LSYPDFLPDMWWKGTDLTEYLQQSTQAVEGIMKPYIGERISPEVIKESYLFQGNKMPDEPRQSQVLQAIRAFPVPVLIDVSFSVSRLVDFSSQLLEILNKKISDYPWQIPNFSSSLLRKYGIYHEMIQAPQDLQTGQSMGLELFIKMTFLNGEPSLINWFDIYNRDPTYTDEKEIGQCLFIIKSAVYTNQDYVFVGVPFYM
jgi:hypothetical protein